MRVDLKYVMKATAKGKTYWYYRRGNHRQRIEGEPGSTRFIANYQRIHDSFEGTTVRIGEEIVAGTFRHLVTKYLASPEFKDLAASTQERYRIYAKPLCDTFGPMPVDIIRTSDVLRWRDRKAETPGAANNMVALMSTIYRWGRGRDLTRVNPADLAAANVKRLPLGEHEPWPPAAIEKFRREAPPEVRWVFEVGLYTGQRQGDILAMRWADIDAGAIHIVQQKTGKEVWVPLHPDLEAVLATVPRRSLHILTTPTGRVWTKWNFQDAMKRARKALDIPYVFHGLRKNAAVALAEVGCSTEEIKAITGHATDSMVSRYVKGASQKRLAKQAMKRLVDGNE